MKLWIAIGGLAVAPMLAGGAGIEWQAEYEQALQLAKDEGRVVFIAVNMDGERANDRLAEKTYQDKRIRELAQSTVNLVASNFDHAKSGSTCPRFGTIGCDQHRRVDVDVRGKVLAPDADGFVIAPQHVWLAPSGEVLLSVPYDVSEAELEWCFVTALRTVDPDFAWHLPSDARAPKRLVMGGVAQTGEETGAGLPPPTRAEALELLDKLKRGLRGDEHQKALRRLAQADEPEACNYMVGILRAAAGGGRGGGGRGGGGPAGDGSEPGKDRRIELLRWIATSSPPSYWEVVAEVLSAGEPALRAQAVVAIEELAAPESLKEVRAALSKEKDAKIKKDLYRALGAVARDDAKARKTLLKQAGDKRQPLWQRNAILALGMLTPDEEVHAFLTELVTSGEGQVREAALAAIALTRDPAWLELLKGDLTGTESFTALLVNVRAVLEGGKLALVRDAVEALGEDDLPRDRLFGRRPPPERE
ncbi:MAG: hypothetical protein H6828_02580 [Planctomycetes bacterium]|nr:hypothetical protein [Planctomycetota bacterium]